MNKNLAIVILAAGKGKRMQSLDKPKVMFEMLGKPMLEYVVETALKFFPSKIIIIVGWQKEVILNYFQKKNYYKQIEFIEQKEQLGTGHAILQTKNALNSFYGNVLILSGDVPLLSSETISKLLEKHNTTNATATILTAKIDNPFGYGRIILNTNGDVEKIVEEKDTNENQKKMNEINSGVYLFNRKNLFDALNFISPNNSQKEYYLTDVFTFFNSNEKKISSYITNNLVEVLGVNTVEDLDSLQKILLENGK